MEVHQLREEKSKRLKHFNDARATEEVLAHLTGTYALSEGMDFERVPLEAQIIQVEEHIKQLKVHTVNHLYSLPFVFTVIKWSRKLDISHTNTWKVKYFFG